MVLTIIGGEKKSGTFTNSTSGQTFDYNNIYLYGLRPVSSNSDDSFNFGMVPESLKLKNDKDFLTSVFGFVPSQDDLRSMEGNEYIVHYDKNSRVEQILAVQKGK